MSRLGLPALALLVATVSIGGVLVAAWASGTFGYDYACCYDPAARRALAGMPIYDLSFTTAGPAGLFDYPPTFLFLVVPFAAILAPAAASVAWVALLIGAFVAGLAVLPVRRDIRWLTLLLASLSWPVVYSLKLGQVGALLFFLFAVAWRFLEDDRVVGAAIAVGAAIKLQPAVLFVWLALRWRWAGVAAGAVVALALFAIVSVFTGPNQWLDLVSLLRQVSDPITTPHSFTPAAIAYQLGAPAALAGAIQVLTVLGSLGVLVAISVRGSAEAGLLAGIVVSQLISPILWDHYAFVLMLPVAWFLERGVWAAALVPLAVAWPLAGITPPIVYPFLYAAVLGGLFVVGQRRVLTNRLVLARA